MKRYFWLSFIFLAGCQKGYKAPELSMSEQFITPAAKFDEHAFNPCYWTLMQDPLLDRLADLVRNQNFELISAQKKIDELRAQYKFQNTQLFPQIGGFGNIRRERDTQTLTFSRFTGFTYQTLYQMGFDATWELDFFGAQKAAKESAFFAMMSQKEKTEYIKLTLVSELVLQYVNLRTAQKKSEILQNQVLVLEELTGLSEQRFGAGLNDQTTSLLNRSRMLEKQSYFEKIQADIDKLIFLVTSLTSQFPDKEYQTLKAAKDLKAGISLIYPDIPSTIILNRPDVSASRFELFSNQAKLKKAYRDFFPQFSITSAYGVLSNFPNLLFKQQSLNWNITPGFNVTLIDFGALIAQKNGAKAQEQQAYYSYENALIKAFSEVETALAGVQATDRQIASLGEEIHSLKIKTLDFKQRFDCGLIEKDTYLESYLEQLYAEELLIEAINARYGFAIAFYKAIGVRI